MIYWKDFKAGLSKGNDRTEIKTNQSSSGSRYFREFLEVLLELDSGETEGPRFSPLLPELLRWEPEPVVPLGPDGPLGPEDLAPDVPLPLFLNLSRGSMSSDTTTKTCLRVPLRLELTFSSSYLL